MVIDCVKSSRRLAALQEAAEFWLPKPEFPQPGCYRCHNSYAFASLSSFSSFLACRSPQSQNNKRWWGPLLHAFWTSNKIIIDCLLRIRGYLRNAKNQTVDDLQWPRRIFSRQQLLNLTFTVKFLTMAYRYWSPVKVIGSDDFDAGWAAYTNPCWFCWLSWMSYSSLLADRQILLAGFMVLPDGFFPASTEGNSMKSTWTGSISRKAVMYLEFFGY